MDFANLSYEQKRKLDSWWQSADDADRGRAAAKLGVKASYIARMLPVYRAAYEEARQAISQPAAPVVSRDTATPPQVDILGSIFDDITPDFEVAVYQKPLTVEADTCVLTSDWHLPKFHWRLWLASLFVARAINAKHYFVLGDMRDNNQAGVTPWPRSWTVPEATGDETIDQLLDLLTKTQQATKCRIWATDGNHDEWPEKNLGGQYWFNRWIAQLPNVTATRLQYCDLITKKGTWRLTHPKGGGVLLSLPRRMRERKFPENHVAAAHTHKLGMGLNVGYWTMEIGGLFWPEAMQYTLQTDKAMEPPQPGFAFLVDGDPYIVSDQHDMRFYLGSYYPHYTKALASLERQMADYYKPVKHTFGATT